MKNLSRTTLAVVVAVGAACSGGGSGGPPGPGSSARRPVASAPVDLSAIVHAVHFAYRSKAGAFEGGHDTYAVAVDAGGAVSFAPAAPSPDGTGPARAGAPLRLETVAVSRGAERIDAAAGAPAVGRDGTVWTPRGPVVEHLRNGPEGVEQSWDFPWRPEGSGDLTVRVRVEGHTPAGATASGLHFVDDGSGLGVRYGKATWIDRLGVASEVPAQLDGSDVVLTVPASVVDGSVFPAVLDPLIVAEAEIDRPVATTWTPATPAVASGTGAGAATLFVWADAARGGIFGARVDGAGIVLDPDGIVMTSDAAAVRPTVAYGSGGPHFLVVWSSTGGLWSRRLQATATALTWVDASPVALPGTQAGDDHASTAYDVQSNVFFVAWQRGAEVVGEVYPQPASGGGIRTYATGLAAGTARPRVGGGITGRLLLAWVTSGGVRVQRVLGAQGGATQNGVLTVTSSAASTVEVASNGTSEWVVVAADAGGHVVGRRVPYTGQPSGNVATLTTASGSQVAPAIAWSNGPSTGSSSPGHYALAWIQAGTTPTLCWQVVRSDGANVSPLTPAGTALVSFTAMPASPAFGLAQRPDPFLAYAVGTQLLSHHLEVSTGGAGTVLPGPLAISTQPSRGQAVPAVAASANGYLVVWQDARTAASDIYGAFLTRSGALGGAFPVASTSASAQTPAVASDGTSFLVVWSDGAIRSSTVSDGGVVSAPVTLSGAASQTAPRVAFAGGQYLVVWQDGAGAGAPNVLGARVSAGGALQGSVSISAGSALEAAPDVAPSPAGDAFQVVWQDARGGSRDVYGARVGAAGAVGATAAISTATNDQAMPSVACGGTGCLVAWADARADGANYDVYAARLDGAGAVLDGAGLAIATAFGGQLRPSVAHDGRDFLVAYEDAGAGVAQVRGNRVSASGAVLDGAGVALGSAGDLAGAYPRLASAEAGRAVLVFTRSTTIPGVNGVWARLLAYRNGVTVAKEGAGTGRVTSTPAGIDCGAACDASFDAGPSVVLTAAADAGMRFTGWTGDCTGTGTCTLATDVARSVTATFERVEWPLTVTRSGTGSGTVNGTGSGTVNGTGISCGDVCTISHLEGTQVTLSASASQGSAFLGWSGPCVLTPTGGCAVTMDGARSVGAQFDLVTHDVVASVPGGGGAVGFSDAGAAGVPGACGPSCRPYLDGATVTLTPVPAGGYRLVGWGGDGTCAGTGACTFVVSASTSVTATFEVIPPVTHALAVTKTGSGSVASTDGAISCGLVCSATSATYVHGTSVTLTATPDPGFGFDGWGGACSGLGPCTVSMTGDLSVSATFTRSPQPLAVTLAGPSGAGSVASSAGGIACPGTCSATFPPDTEVTLTATPSPAPAGGGSYVFSGWSGACAGTGTCTVTLDTPRAVTATFAFVPPPTYQALTVVNPGGGTVTDDRGQISCGTACTGSWVDGTVVTLTATQAAGASFGGWGGACSGRATTCQVTLDAAKSVTATFTYPVTVSAAGSGTGTVSSSPAGISCGASCSAQFAYDATVGLSAAAGGASVFAGWSGAGCSGIGGCSVRVLGPTTVTATFDIPPPQRYDLTVARQGLGGGTVTSDAGGISCGTACAATYDARTRVTLTAGASTGSVFGGWSGGGCSGTVPTCTVTMDASETVTARFDVAPPSTHVLTVRRTGSGMGTVTSAPAAIDCGPACSAAFSAGSLVTLAARPSAGSSFAGWTGGGCSGLGPCTVTMNAGVTVYAAFAASSWTAGSFPLATAVGGPGSGTVTADADLGLTCARQELCAVDVASASPPRVVTLRATPASDSRFAGWIDGCTGTGDCVLAMDRSRLARAVFVPRLAQLAVSLSGQGSIERPAGARTWACDRSSCVGTFLTDGAPVVLTPATTAEGWHFAGWVANECTGTGPCTVSADRDRSLAARFAPDAHALTVLVLGAAGTSRVVGGGIDCTGSGAGCSLEVPNTTPPREVTLTAQADPESSVFLGWLGGCGARATCTYAVGAPTVAIATFGPRTYDAAIQPLGLGSGTVTGGGLSCTTGSPAGCTGAVPRGEVTFVATPEDDRFFFAGWGGVCPRTTDPACTVDFVGSGTVQAVFEPYTLPLEVGIAGPGSVSGPAGFSCSGDGRVCSLPVDNTLTPERAQVTLTATAAAGAEFWGWSGPCQVSGRECTVTMYDAVSVTANFRVP